MLKRVLVGLLLFGSATAPVVAEEPKMGGVINAVIQPNRPA